MMNATELQRFLDNALGERANCWQQGGVNALGALSAPDSLFGAYPSLFRGDVHRLWAEWFLGACVDVDRLARDASSYPLIYKTVRDYCVQAAQPAFAAEELAKVLARLANEEACRLRVQQKRPSISRGDRQLMVDLADGQPRCWICGYKFRDEAIDNFLECKQTHSIPAPRIVDLFKPIGLKPRDMGVEVDHVLPLSKGGSDGDNLRMACGWCNRHKSNHASLYDVGGGDRPASAAGTYYSLPQPLWVVRMLAHTGRSELSGTSSNEAELTVTLRRAGGKATPPNLRVVTCEESPIEQRVSLEKAIQIMRQNPRPV